jgi:uncharacterized membrane protein
MAVISDCVDIDASPSDVWSVLADVRRLPDYSTSTVAVIDAPDCLERKGQEFTQVVKVLGRRWTSKWKVLQFEPDSLLCSQGTVGPGVQFTLTQSLQARGAERSTLRLEIHYEVPGGSLGRMAAKAGLESRAKKEAAAIMNGIRVAAEARQPTPA